MASRTAAQEHVAINSSQRIGNNQQRVRSTVYEPSTNFKKNRISIEFPWLATSEFLPARQLQDAYDLQKLDRFEQEKLPSLGTWIDIADMEAHRGVQ